MFKNLDRSVKAVLKALILSSGVLILGFTLIALLSIGMFELATLWMSTFEAYGILGFSYLIFLTIFIPALRKEEKPNDQA